MAFTGAAIGRLPGDTTPRPVAPMLSARAVSVLLLAYAGFIVYGSLVPLDFQALPLGEAWQHFEAMPFLRLGVGSRADWIANGVLYAPLGFLLAWRAQGSGWWTAAAAGGALALGTGLALAVEFAQVFFPPRTVSLNDVMAECIGTFVGAVSALAYRWRGRPLAVARPMNGSWFASHGLQVYAAAYLAFCLFPYDLLISGVEIDQKLSSDLWGWWLAGQRGRPFVAAIQLIVEIMLALPLGVLVGHREDRRPAQGWGRAALIGLAIGIGIEAAQLLIASGITQGASVLTRLLGVLAGLALWRGRDRFSIEGVRATLARSAGAWAPAYLIVLVAVNGWFTFEWQGQDAAAAQWRELRLLPFYYHYYTTEAQALFSLANVMAMYLPVAALAWAWRRSAGAAALWGVALCTVIEASKLWLVGLHPDPTNLWIAAAACWLFVAAFEAIGRRERALIDAEPTGVVAPESTVAEPRAGGHAAIALGLVLLLLTVHLLSLPAFAIASTIVLAACATAVWLKPIAAVLIVPALLPVLDLAPWTGRLFWDEFDLLLAICLCVGLLRRQERRLAAPIPPGESREVAEPHVIEGSTPSRQRAAGDPLRLIFVPLLLSFALSAVHGAMPWPWPDANSFSSYVSPYNGLRIAKGVLWAGLFIALLHRFSRSGHDPRRALASGMTWGLVYVVLFVAWERLAFVGLFDMADAYRVTGPFSAMHRGGGFIECYIAIAVPFVALRVLEAGRWWVRLAGAGLLLGATYAMMVTFSRNGYAAFGVSILSLLVLARRDGPGPGKVIVGLIAAAMLAVALSALLSPFARERLAHWQHDLAVRQAHWADALAMRDKDGWTTAFGMGVGRFPDTHLWRSREPVQAASYRLGSDGERRYLRLGGGAGRLYIDQLVTAPTSRLQLALRLRSNQPGAVFHLSLCEKWMLTSRNCVATSVRAGTSAGVWTPVETTLDAAALGTAGGLGSRPLKWALHTPAQGTHVDVTDIGLRTSDGRELLVNGDFRSGMDHWLFSTDVEPPWQIDSLPVAVLFDQGWFGVAAWTLLLGTALYRGASRAWHGDRHATVALASLSAFLVSASLNTLIDDPRFLFLLLVLASLCCLNAKQARIPSPARRAL